jgi:hypothetical protein
MFNYVLPSLRGKCKHYFPIYPPVSVKNFANILFFYLSQSYLGGKKIKKLILRSFYRKTSVYSVKKAYI